MRITIDEKLIAYTERKRKSAPRNLRYLSNPIIISLENHLDALYHSLDVRPSRENGKKYWLYAANQDMYLAEEDYKREEKVFRFPDNTSKAFEVYYTTGVMIPTWYELPDEIVKQLCYQPDEDGYNNYCETRF